MSKQSQAKEAQGYTTESKSCAICSHRQCKVELPAWMQRYNAVAVEQKRPIPYPMADYGRESEQRCGIGGFAIKKTATCDKWAARESS